MSKELQALVIKIDKSHWGNKIEAKEINYCIDKIKEREQRLEAIENAETSKALECLDTIRENLSNKTLRFNLVELLDIIEEALLKTQKMEKVLKIVFEKNVDFDTLTDSETLDDYNSEISWRYRMLTEKEFNFLKEVVIC